MNNEMDKKSHLGGCACGHIRFLAIGRADFPHTCSCSICQRHTGAMTVGWVEFDSANVVWTGEGGKPSVWRSSEKSSRAFCPKCGSSLGAIDDAPTVALLTGAFDTNHLAEFKPQSHSYVSKLPKWWRFH
jgi:hypothetical protein